MRVSRLGVAILGFVCAGMFAGDAFAITTTPSHTATATPTVTPTPTVAATPAHPTPWAAASPEFSINTTTGTKVFPAVALGADDRFLAVWNGEGDGDGSAIFGRLFDWAGQPLGGEFQVNTATAGYQYTPAIASNSGGDFVVVWASVTTQSESAIRAQLFDSAGSPIGSEIPVNSYTTGRHIRPDVTFRDNGFTVVWATDSSVGPGPVADPDGVYLRRFSPLGVPLGGDTLVNTYTTGYQGNPKVSSGTYGTVVVWDSTVPNEDLTGDIYAQVYDETGSPDGPERRINSRTYGGQILPDVAMGHYGREYIVVWRSASALEPASIWARGVNGASEFLGPDFQVSPNGGGYWAPTVALDHTFREGFVVAWSGLNETIVNAPQNAPPRDTAIFAQRFNNAPFPTTGFYRVQPPRRGETLQVDTHTYQTQSFPAIGSGSDGRFIVVWQSNFEDGTRSIEGRRFDFPAAAPLRVDAHPSGGVSNVNGVLETGERVVVEPGWRTRSASTSVAALSGTASNPTGPAGPVYTIPNQTAQYGTIGETGADCYTATANCYEFSLAGARPATHWDATIDESLQSPDPIGSMTKTWSLHVGGSFPDVPQDAFYPFIENIFHNGVTAGGGCGSGLFCGDEPVLRRQMAVFLLKAAYGQNFVPPEATGAVFDDVPAANPFAPWIEELARIGVTAGCSAPPPPALPSFCPAAPVNRQQMAAFVSKTYVSFAGSTCHNTFDDVPCSSPFATYIEYLAHRGVVGGCSVSPPLYCPTDVTKRKQMAVFLVKTFGLELYGPD